LFPDPTVSTIPDGKQRWISTPSNPKSNIPLCGRMDRKSGLVELTRVNYARRQCGLKKKD
jgi:hypothetical protein